MARGAFPPVFLVAVFAVSGEFQTPLNLSNIAQPRPPERLSVLILVSLGPTVMNVKSL